MTIESDHELAEKIAAAVLEKCKVTLLEAYESAGMSGLCDEGRWEMAIGSLQTLDLQKVIDQVLTNDSPKSDKHRQPR